MNCSTPGFPVLHHLPELAQIHVTWVSDAIQASHPVVPFSSCPQSCPASGSFPMSWLFASGGQSIGASASTPVLPMNIQAWFPLGLTDLLAVQGTLKNLLQHHSSKVSILGCSTFFMVQLSHPYMTNGEGNSKPLQYSCLENPMNSMKRQKDMTLKDEPPQVSRCPIYYWGRAEKLLQKEWRGWAKAEMMPSCGYISWWKLSPVL